MGTEIKTSLQAALSAGASLQEGLQAFCSPGLVNLGNVIPVTASTDHDVRLCALLRDSLGAYARMVSGDVDALQAMHEGLEAADNRMASAFEVS